MPTPGAEQANGGVGGAAKQVAEHASAIARLELELASLELKKKVTSLGIGVGLAIGAALFGVLHGRLPARRRSPPGSRPSCRTWLALLIMTLFLAAARRGAGLIGRSRIKKGAPPLPEQAIREAKLTEEALRQ